ncbi:hypothetical protein BGX28_005005 [Mortierella sp. GBA30]|nr:hypothetical protein BGX28_005005 [Mortierella sp. GBA30]
MIFPSTPHILFLALSGIVSVLAVEGDIEKLVLGGGGGGGGGALQCPSAGFFCESTLLQYSRMLSSTIPQLLYGGGHGGGESTPSSPSSRYYACAGRDARPIAIASCPQDGCQKDYCIGGGPANVPQGLSGGDGLYCGKTIMQELRRGRGVSHLGGGSGDVGGGAGGGPGQPSRDEYNWNNLYYFVGSQGVNLGPCSGRCVNAGSGMADYCA